VLGAAWVVLGSFLGVSLYAGLALWVDAWRYHPELAELAAFGVCTIALAGGAALLYRGDAKPRQRVDKHSDEDDEGGQPPPSPPPVPRDPSGLAGDWERFDRARADWDRVPVGG